LQAEAVAVLTMAGVEEQADLEPQHLLLLVVRLL
jgi:hypothetical protein